MRCMNETINPALPAFSASPAVQPARRSRLWFPMPMVLTAWVAWLVLAVFATPKTRLIGVLLAVTLPWSYFLAVRMEGLTGGVAPDFRWRWTPTAEDLFLAEHAKRGAPASSQPALP